MYYKITKGMSIEEVLGQVRYLPDHDFVLWLRGAESRPEESAYKGFVRRLSKPGNR